MQRSDWEIRRADPVPELLRERFGDLRAQVLWQRGFDNAEDAERHLDPRLEALSSPFTLLNMEVSAERVAEAMLKGEPIVVYSDYDIDGISGLAILMSFFSSCRFEPVIAYQPDRLSEGYGVHAEAIRGLAARGARVVITVDSGITALDAASESKRLGIDFIVTDHHQQALELPDTIYIVNPNQKACTSGLTYLSGAGIAFYLAIAVRSVLRKKGYFSSTRPEPDLRDLLDLLVLGTIADSVELRGDNRVLVRAGLRRLGATQRPGLRQLMSRCLLNKGIDPTARDVAFSIAPKLNAASRMGQAHLSTELLLAQDAERAAALVDQIMLLNEERTRVQSSVFDQALEQAESQVKSDDPPVLVVHGDWHEGVLGVVAAKLVERLGRPSIVLAKVKDQALRGSMRTLPKVHCLKLLDSCKDALTRYGGHRMAAGMALASDKVREFTQGIWEAGRAAGTQIFEADPVSYDGLLPLKINLREIIDLDSLAPWGMGNPEPLFLMPNLDLRGKSVMKDSHFKCKLPEGGELIGFHKNKLADGLLAQAEGRPLQALVVPEINRFRGQATVQLRLEHLRIQPADPAGT